MLKHLWRSAPSSGLSMRSALRVLGVNGVRVLCVCVLVGLAVLYATFVFSLADFVSLTPQRNRRSEPRGTTDATVMPVGTSRSRPVVRPPPACEYDGAGYVFLLMRTIDPVATHGWGMWGLSLTRVVARLGYPVKVAFYDDAPGRTISALKADGDRVIAIFMQNFMEDGEQFIAAGLGPSFWPRIFYGVFMLNAFPFLAPQSPVNGSHVMCESEEQMLECRRDMAAKSIPAVCAELPIGTDVDAYTPQEPQAATSGVPIVYVKYASRHSIDEEMLLSALREAGVHSYVLLKTRHGGPERHAQWGYHNQLRQAPWIMFYLPISASGISQALQEMRRNNVPVFLIPSRTHGALRSQFTPQDGVVHPYKHPWPELPSLIKEFIAKGDSFTPRKAVIEQLSYAKCASRLFAYMQKNVPGVRELPKPRCSAPLNQ